MRQLRSPVTRAIQLGVLYLTLAACVPVPVKEEPSETPEIPVRIVEGATHYQVSREGTLVYARVFKGGRLARLGHNHIVLFNDVRGDVFLAEAFDESVFDLAVSPARATVDPPDLRQTQGEEFETRVSENARESTRQNMLGSEVLDSENHPYVTIRSTDVQGSNKNARVTADISIKRTNRQITIPVSLEVEGDRLVATGRFEILQSDYGIQPYSVLGGALKVEDRVEIVFAVAAKKL